HALDHEGSDLRRQDAQCSFRQAELAVAVGNGDVADAGQAKTTTEDRALQYGDDHLWRLLELFQHGAEGAVQLAVGIAAAGTSAGHVPDVAAGAEVASGTAQHLGAHITLLADAVDHRAPLVYLRQAHGIAAVRTVQ